MRAGIFGGTFNPIHNGHLMVARKVLRHFNLDRLYLIPCRQPPHKSPAFLAPAEHRLQMIRLAIAHDDERLMVSDIETRREGPSYTIDTIDQMAGRLGGGGDLFLVMGLDAFLELHTWKHQRRIRSAVQLVVVTRRLDDEHAPYASMDRMNDYIHGHLTPDYAFDAIHASWHSTGLGRAIHLLSTDPVDVSSSQVRQRIKAGLAIAGLVPAAVCTYIEKKELYR